MALRLSSPSNSTTSTMMYLNRVVDDTSLSADQKATCFKYLSIIIKNLACPTKSQNIKYRTLNLDNAKLQEGLFSIAVMMEVLTTVIGFTAAAAANALSSSNENDNTNTTATSDSATTSDPNKTLVLPLEQLPPTDFLQQLLSSITDVQGRVVNNNNNKSCSSSSSSSSSAVVQHPLEKLSEKQKARRLLEEKQKAEKIKAKEERKRNLQMLQEDKYTRENDPNWKPGVSAACAKSGTGLKSFRDRHGE